MFPAASRMVAAQAPDAFCLGGLFSSFKDICGAAAGFIAWEGFSAASQAYMVQVPDPSLGRELSQLLESGAGADVTFKVEDEELKAHRIVLTARSPMFAALLNSPMREGEEGVVTFPDVRVPVFRGVLHFVYTDSLPEVCMPPQFLKQGDFGG